MDACPAEIIRLNSNAYNRSAGFSAFRATSVNERDQSYHSYRSATMGSTFVARRPGK
jgi:hypothetical protein